MFTIKIEKIVQGGMGLGRREGKVIFVPYVLSGEVVEVEKSLQRGSNYEVAETFRIVHPSSERISSLCPYFKICGGCQFHHMEYTKEKEIKKEIFIEVFNRMGRIADRGTTYHSASPLGYRNRVRFHIGESQQIGFKEPKGSTVVPIDRCIVCVNEIQEFLHQYREGSRENVPKNPFTVFGYGGKYYWEGNSEEVAVEILGKRIQFSLSSFFQSNLNLLAELIQDVLLPLQGEEVLELYGGVGTFSLFLQDRFSQLTLVEENPSAARYAVKNLDKKRCRIVTSSVEQWFSSQNKKKERGRYETVLVDPPRSGLSKRARDVLIQLSPLTILYISCNLVTLARDVRFLLEAGYSLAGCDLYDFYPRTAHMEAVCKLIRSF
ncbi:MAG: class I SAM-dependent RNA methyltransferase [Spirochaetales bacterium]|nr:class I SAM-dependent RNA methyltransferase [Spirochaetales bacterium]